MADIRDRLIDAVKAEGEGQGACKRCLDKGKRNRTWMCFLYRVYGHEGYYCKDCVIEMQKEAEKTLRKKEK